MPAFTHTLKQGDRLPALESVLEDASGPVDCSTASSVKFHMKMEGETTAKVDAAASAVDASAGHYKYEWGASDTDTPGTYMGNFVVTFPTSKPMTFPNDDYIEIVIRPKLA